MYVYTLGQWLLFFFLYCFLGWVWESCYVSAKRRQWVNRGFLHGPMLPIYGTGAVIILLATIVIWAGSTFGYVDGAFTFSTEMELENSVLGIIGGAICWIFSPLGFGEIKATVATIMGLVAKEEVVGVFGVLDFEGLTPLAGYAFLAFNLLCAPCFAAIGAIRREMNSAKWTWFAIGYQCGFAYVVSLIIYQVGSLFTGNVNVIGLIFAILFIALIIFQLARPYKESETLLLKNKAKASV